ncbi:MAG: TIGR04086 family membrane protein [Bacilli bacterium]|nr:TIGR04086 family membrane protein [Bacilli bacterium]
MKYLKTLLFELIIIIILTLIITIFYYFNIINSNISSLFKIISFIITFLLSGIYIAKRSNKKYYLEGLIISSINILLFTLLSLAFNNGFNIKQLLYYLLLTFVITFGSILGGNLKKNKN